jgi:glycosyltransferase involved in cell wall biosynthesis
VIETRDRTQAPVRAAASRSGRPLRLFVVEPRPTGGMIHYAFQLCAALAETGADVTLVTSRGFELDDVPRSFRVEEVLRLWKPVAPTISSPGRARRLGRKLRRVPRGAIYVREWRRLTRYLNEQRPDVVQFGKLEFPIDGYFLRRLRSRGLVLTQVCHEFERREHGRGLAPTVATKLTASAYESFSALFFHGEHGRERFASLFDVPRERLHVIPHQGPPWVFARLAGGAETRARLRRRYRLADGVPVVLFFGTIMPSKGLTDLIEAFPLVRRSTAATLVVAGFPTKFVDVGELGRLVERLGISDSVRLDARYVPFAEVGPLLELASVVVYPYRTSTESGAVQLACAFGRPVVATTTDALRDVVEDGRSGLLVEPGDREQLADAISRILVDPELGAAMGEYARHLSDTRHTWSALAGRILSVTDGVRA